MDPEKSQKLKEKKVKLSDLKMTSTERGFIQLQILDRVLLINPRYATHFFLKLQDNL